MLRRRVVLVLAISIAMGLLTAYLVYRTVSGQKVQQAEMDEILVAKANIGLGEALTPSHVQLTPWPKATLPPGYLRSVKDIEGRVARGSISIGEPILESKLAPTGQGGLMPVLVPSGKRAVSVVVDQAVQKSGFVLPNSRVDVVVTMAPKGTAMGEKEARIVLQDIPVLAADQHVEMKDNKPVTMTTVTMAVSPEEAERLALAQNEGKVTFALRNLQDTDQVSTPGVTTAQLMGTPAPPPSRERERKPARPARLAAKHPARPKLEAKAATPPVSTMPPPATPVAPPAPPPLPTHTVSVIRGVSSTEMVFVQDPDGGWQESPGKPEVRR